jgi:hypothetical protein
MCAQQQSTKLRSRDCKADRCSARVIRVLQHFLLWQHANNRNNFTGGTTESQKPRRDSSGLDFCQVQFASVIKSDQVPTSDGNFVIPSVKHSESVFVSAGAHPSINVTMRITNQAINSHENICRQLCKSELYLHEHLYSREYVPICLDYFSAFVLLSIHDVRVDSYCYVFY